MLMIPKSVALVVAAAVAAIAVSWTGLLFDSLESAVAAVFLPRPEVFLPDGFMSGGMDVIDHPPEFAGVLNALGFAVGLTFVGLLLGSVPLAIAAIVIDWRYECTRTWPFTSVTFLQGAYSFQLCSLIAAALVATLLVAIEWPIDPQDGTVVLLAMMVGVTAVNQLGMRLWVRLIADTAQSGDRARFVA